MGALDRGFGGIADGLVGMEVEAFALEGCGAGVAVGRSTRGVVLGGAAGRGAPGARLLAGGVEPGL